MTNPNNVQLFGKSIKITIHLHTFDPPKMVNLMTKPATTTTTTRSTSTSSSTSSKSSIIMVAVSKRKSHNVIYIYIIYINLRKEFSCPCPYLPSCFVETNTLTSTHAVIPSSVQISVVQQNQLRYCHLHREKRKEHLLKNVPFKTID